METNLVLRVSLFEMSTFFHVNYYAEDTYVVGYGVGMSPFYCFKALSSRPINLNFCCISGGFASTTRPDLFWVHAVKEEMACNKSKAEHYEEICRDIESSPILNVQDKDCDVIVERLDSIKKIVL